MSIMSYKQFSDILNETIFEKSKSDLLEKIAKYPERYIGIFRPTKAKAKILQNILQSHEIRFGDAFEQIIEEYLRIKECEILSKKFDTENGEKLNIDQCFKRKKNIYFIEQKVRDDHDSTKKRGQIQNFEKKLNLMLKKYGENNLIGILYFIDPHLTKNKDFYVNELNKMSRDYNVETHIHYGEELFNYLGYNDVWQEIIEYLTQWKNSIPDLPEINFDLDAEHTFNEIKNLSPQIFRKILENDEIFNQIALTLFPQKQTLKLLYNYFLTKEETIYQTLSKKLSEKIKI